MQWARPYPCSVVTQEHVVPSPSHLSELIPLKYEVRELHHPGLHPALTCSQPHAGADTKRSPSNVARASRDAQHLGSKGAAQPAELTWAQGTCWAGKGLAAGAFLRPQGSSSRYAARHRRCIGG